MSQQAELVDHTPLIEALLTLPASGSEGTTAVCSNTIAGGQVLNELGEIARSEVPVIGTMIVSRDGAERMVINALDDPTVRTIVLFGEEGQSFAPSSNLLLALMNGIDTEGGSNKIVGGLGSAAAYPNLTAEILDSFRDTITVLPLFTSKRPTHSKILDTYLRWLRGRAPAEVCDFLDQTAPKDKIYYDKLNEVLELLKGRQLSPKPSINLDPQAFKNLQPPILELSPINELPKADFHVSASELGIVVCVKVGDEVISLKGDDEFELSYNLMKLLGERKQLLSPLEQLLLGAELGRAGVQMRGNGDEGYERYSIPTLYDQGEYAPLESVQGLTMDKDYYYKVAVRSGVISVMCMAHDSCEEVFDLHSISVVALLEKLAELDRFENYGMDILHRLDIGAQIGRAGIAAKHGLNFMQDFPLVFGENSTHFPFRVYAADSFLSVHKGILTTAFTEGLTERHADEHKGPARSLGVLAVFRSAATALETMPKLYQQGAEPIERTRAAYRDQLLRRDHDGDYSYGERTQVHFGVDQLQAAIEGVRQQPQRAFVVQRYDPLEDMSYVVDEQGKPHYSHDPCLTHDVYWVSGNGKLQSLHIARAHNLVNAYPDNVFGLYDAYVSHIATEVGLEVGDMFVLSSRGNVLLLTEEQRLKDIVVEPAKPIDLGVDQSAGPESASFLERSSRQRYLALDEQIEIGESLDMSSHSIVQSLLSYQGRNLIEAVSNYLVERGSSHNNPVMSTFQPERDDPQSFSMPFFQANVYAGKLQTTAVFVNPDSSKLDEYRHVCHYLSKLIARRLKVDIAPMNVLYVPL